MFRRTDHNTDYHHNRIKHILPPLRVYLPRVIVNDLMRESRAGFAILHLAPVLFTGVLVAVYAGPSATLDIVHPKGVLHVVVSLIFVLAETLKTVVVAVVKRADLGEGGGAGAATRTERT